MQLLSSIADLKDIVNKEYIDSILADYVLSANLGALATKDSLAFSDLTSRPSKLSDFTDDVVAGKYLPLTGGTISGTSVAPLIINTSSSESSVVFRINSDSKTQIGYNPYLGSFIYNYSSSKSIGIKDDGTPHYNGNTIYHAGNFNPADYLPLSGGTISGGSGALEIKRNGPYLSNIKFSNTDGKLGELGFVWANNPAFFHTDGNYYTLIHSGNIGDQKVASADSAKVISDYSNSRITSADVEIFGDSGVRKFIASSYMTSGKPPEDGSILHFSWDTASGYEHQLFISSNKLATPEQRMAWRAQDEGVWGDWKTIAFTDSNVASAQALKHSNGTVGATVTANGVLCISAQGIFNSDASLSLFDFNGAQLSVGYSMRNSYITNIYGNTIKFTVGNATKMLINSSGNVGIGTTDPKYTLDVNGQLSTPYYLSFRNASDSEFSYIGRGGSAEVLTIMTYGAGNPLNFGTNSKTRMYINGDGNVTIGTTDLAGTSYALCVNGVNKFYDKDNTLKLYTSIKGSGVQVGRTTSAYTGGYNAGVTIGEDDSNLGFIAGAYNESTGSSKILFHYGGTNQFDASIFIKGISGNVGIANANPAYKLDVAGSIRTTSSLTIGTIVLTDENGTLKIAGNAYTTGQLGAGEVGQPTSGGGNVILDYDSIVGALGFTPAKQNDLSSLTNRVFALESAGPSSSSSLYGDEITIGSSVGNIYISSEDNVQIDTIMGSVLVNGSEVLTKANTSFTRNYSSGTKIGTIKIGGVSTDIYAPASSSSSLWTTEYDMTVGSDVLAASKEYIGTNTIVGWDSAGLCVNDLYIGYDGYTIWMQGSVDEASDMRLKTVIDAVNLDIRDIAFAPIFNYVFKSRPQGRQMLGSSAQYWQAIAPSAVSENDKGNLAMNYGAIALASVVAVAKKVVTHEEEIAELKSKVQSLETRLAKYELN